jgi:hypothetical protein
MWGLSGDDQLRKVEVRDFADSSSMRAVANDTHYVPPNQIPLTLRDSGILSRNLDAFEKRKDVTSVSLPKDLIPVEAQVLVTRPFAPLRIKATKLLLLMEKMSCLAELKFEMTSANLAALSSGGEGNLVPGRSSLAPADDLISAQVLVTRSLALAGDFRDARAPVKDLSPVEAHALASLEDEKEALASLEDLKDACAPVEDLIPVEAHVLVTRHSPLLGRRRKLSLLLRMKEKLVLLWTFKFLSQDAQPCGHSRSSP